MAITGDTVGHVARLARLALDAAEREAMVEKLSAIIEHVSRLGGLDTTGVPPRSHALPRAGAAWRPDEPERGLDRPAALANAPAADGQSFCVPAVIEGPGDGGVAGGERA